MPFANSIVGGAKKLIRQAIQSPNFVHLVSGWSINKDGTAEFQDAIIRGTITAGDFIGTNFEINGDGFFFYKAAPALGTLVFSLTPDNFVGTDSHGNTIQGGDTNYVDTGGGFFAANFQGGNVNFFSAPSANGAYTEIGAFGTTTGLDLAIVTQLASGDISVGPAASGTVILGRTGGDIVLVQHDAEIVNLFKLDDIAIQSGNLSGKTRLYSSSGEPHVIDSTGQEGSINFTQTDLSTNTVTQAALNPLSATFNQRANNPEAGTTYRLRCWGDGQQGSTQQGLTIAQMLGGANINSFLIAAAGGLGAINTPFDWWIEADYICSTTGAPGTGRAIIRGAFEPNNASPNQGNSTVPVRFTGGISWDTTVGRNMQINAQWSSTTGGPTITCRGSTFERLGP